jgi:excisionase family DNA binding protein
VAIRSFVESLTRAADRLPFGEPDKLNLTQLRDLLAADGVSTGTAAAILGVGSKNTVKRILDEGLIEGATQTPGGHWRIPPEALLEYRAAQLARRATGSLKPARTAPRRFGPPR